MTRNIQVLENQKKVIPIIWTGKETDFNFRIRLAGRGAKLTLLMLLLGVGDRKLSIITDVTHEKPNTQSQVVIKGALSDFSNVNFEGLVKIEKGAKNSKAWLAAHLLLLSNSAGGRAVPKLEILENDVKAGHASTIGKIDDAELFYLMSRGLTKETAKKLVVQGFLESILMEFPIKDAESARKKLKWI
jgi:Fe-S cluster assembly protein SufD